MLQPMHMTAPPAGTACSGTFIWALLPPGTDWWGSVQMGVLPACAGRHSAAQPTWGKSKHCTVFVTGSSSQHGETPCYYCCSIQNTDTHDLWTKLSQVTPVLYSRRWGMNHCPHLKTGRKQIPYINYYISFLLTAFHLEDAQLTLDDNVHYLCL